MASRKVCTIHGANPYDHLRSYARIHRSSCLDGEATVTNLSLTRWRACCILSVSTKLVDGKEGGLTDIWLTRIRYQYYDMTCFDYRISAKDRKQNDQITMWAISCYLRYRQPGRLKLPSQMPRRSRTGEAFRSLLPGSMK